MQPNKGAFPEDQFENESEKEKKASSNEGLDNVVDELRNVLSDLISNSSTKKKEIPPSPENPPSSEVPVDHEPEQPPVIPPEPPQASSDADFWKGDVLGWASQPSDVSEEKTPPPEKTVQPPEVIKEPPPPSPLKEPGPEDWLRKQTGPSAEKMNKLRPAWSDESEADSPNFQDPESPGTSEPQDFSPLKDPNDFSSELESEDKIPPHASPFFYGAGMEQNEELNEPMPPPAPKEEFPDPFSVPPPPKSPNEMDDGDRGMPVPIPGTIGDETFHASPPSKKEKEDFTEEEHVKPPGLIQVACFFPEGQEKLGQQFISTMKKACEKSKKTISLQAVFVQPWSSGGVDLVSWVKTSQMQGADFIYVLSSKTDKGLFKDLIEIAHDEKLKGRIVAIEQVGLRALYADCLVELARLV